MIWVALGALVFAIIVGLGALTGAPYLPILAAERERVLDELGFAAGQTLLDLGSGDGTMLLAVARRGGVAIGIEINPFWWLVSVLRTRRYRGQIQVYLGSFWDRQWPAADVVYVFLIARFTAKLEQECAVRLKQTTTLASYGFALPQVRAQRQNGALYLYQYPLDGR